MTTEIIQRFAREHGISTIRSMVVLTELLKQKKDSMAVESGRADMIPNFSVEQIGW